MVCGAFFIWLPLSAGVPDFPGDVDDATSLELPGAQQKLLDAAIETGKPVNVVISSGRPYNLGGVENRIAAQVMTFFSGQDICNFWRI